MLQSLPTQAYNVTLISPTTYFAFTPLLPSACVGTVEARSLVEPIRKLIARVRGHYLMGSAVDIDMAERLVEVEVPADQGTGTKRAYVPCEWSRCRHGSTKQGAHRRRQVDHRRRIHVKRSRRQGSGALFPAQDCARCASRPTTNHE